MAGGVTIARVAEVAGVGIGTVSRVLNGHPNVAEPTRARVVSAIEALGYRPSHAASSLPRGTGPGAVAVVMPFLTRPSVVDRLAGVIASLDRHGLDAVVYNVETHEQLERHLTAIASRHLAEGLIIASVLPRRELVDALRLRRVPLVALDAAVPGVPGVLIDDVASGSLATSHLLGLGHRRIGFIGDDVRGSLLFTSSEHRLQGYQQALAEAGVVPDPQLVRTGSHGAAQAEADAFALLELAVPPTAIFAASDTQAMGVLRAAERRGLRVPAELSVVGFDDIEVAHLLGLSTVRQPLRRSGELAADVLVERLTGTGAAGLPQVLTTELIARSTTGPPPRAAPAPAPSRRHTVASHRLPHP